MGGTEREFGAGSMHARLAAAAVPLAAIIFLLAYLYGRPLLYGGGFIPPAMNTSLTFSFFCVGLLAIIGRHRGAVADAGENHHTSKWFLCVFLLLTAGLVTAGAYYYRSYERHYRAEVERQLSAIANLKVSELGHWRQERIGDATVFLGNNIFAELVQRCTETPSDPLACARIRLWLGQVKKAYQQYDRVFLLGLDAIEIASDPALPEPVTSSLKSALSRSLHARQVTFLDFYRDGPNLPIHLSILVPIYAPQEPNRQLGVLVLRIDPFLQLYSIIKQWPTASRTAETLLVRRDGNDVLFLCELRFRGDAALFFRLPLTNTRTPAVMAALGHEGSFEGLDYRGVAVLSELRAVPGSPWALVARMDTAEVYAPLTERLWQMVFFIAVLLFGVGATLGLVWRQQTFRLYREKLDAANALRESETRYQTLMEHAPVAVFIDRQDRIVEANQACLQLFGARDKEQLIGKSPFDLLPPNTRDTIRERVHAWRESGEDASHFEETIVRLDGAAVDVDISAAPILDRGVSAIHVALRDITKRKQTERALLASENELRQRNDELTRFTYTVSHDLKSPLVTIQTFLGYLEQDLAKKDSPAVEKDFGFIRTAGQKMSRLLGELLALSRVGRIKNPPKDVPLKSIVEEALALVAGRIAQRKVRIELTQEPIILCGDRARLVEVFQNLVDNAVKFMAEQPSPLVEIGVEDGDNKEGTVLFVRDNGIGIDSRHVSKLFGLFEKLDPKSEGTGIGLALVRRIVEVHGGRIWVESGGLGHGACFRFTLPGTRRHTEKETQ